MDVPKRTTEEVRNSEIALAAFSRAVIAMHENVTFCPNKLPKVQETFQNLLRTIGAEVAEGDSPSDGFRRRIASLTTEELGEVIRWEAVGAVSTFQGTGSGAISWHIARLAYCLVEWPRHTRRGRKGARRTRAPT